MTALEFIKAKIQPPAAILLVRDNPSAQRLLVAWTLYSPEPLPAKYAQAPSHEKDNPQILMRALWELLLPINEARLADLSDIPQSKVKKIFWRLAEAGLLFPDGTISNAAQRLLTAEAERYIKTLQPGSKAHA